MDDITINYQAEHPQYTRMYKRWKMAHDFFRSGVNVLQPDYDIGSYKIGVKRREPPLSLNMEDNSLEPNVRQDQSEYEWYTVPQRSYLWKNKSEDAAEYENRQARAVHIPFFQPLVNIFVSAVLRTGAAVHGADNGLWKDFSADIDLTGTDADGWRREVLSGGLEFGRMHALVDMPRDEGAGSILSLEDQMNHGLRPYVYMISPMQILNWSLDARKQLRWVQILEEQPDQREPGQVPSDILYQVRVVTKTDWQIWRRPSEKAPFVLVADGEHICNRVPLETFWAVRERRWDCESPLCAAVDLDRHLFNKLSALDELEDTQSFSLLAVGLHPNQRIGSLEIGPRRAFGYDSSAGTAPSFISPPGDHARIQWEHIKEKYATGRQAHGVSKSIAEAPSADRTEAAISAQGEDKRNLCALFASNMEAFENRIYDLAAQYMRLSERPRAEYVKNFDLGGVTQQIQDVIQLGSREEITPMAIARLMTPIMDRMMRDHGIAQEKITEALESVNAKAAELMAAPPAPALAPMEDPLGN